VSVPDRAHEDDRDRLVRACIETLDVAPTDAIRSLMERALRDVGVEAVYADGETFDGTRHRAVDTTPTGNELLHNRVSATERPGYLDHGTLIRPPEVVVYRSTTS
jgi:molecular chaperone GrpE (heat shock protein)